VKNTDTAGQKGYDAGKKISGIKRHLAVDTQGLPHAIAVTTAEVTDRNGALAAFDRCAGNLEHVTSVLVDGGYSGKPFSEAVQQTLGATVQIAKRSQLHTFAVMLNDGSSNGLLRGSKSAGDSGRTANEN
jgi:transposase